MFTGAFSLHAKLFGRYHVMKPHFQRAAYSSVYISSTQHRTQEIDEQSLIINVPGEIYVKCSVSPVCLQRVQEERWGKVSTPHSQVINLTPKRKKMTPVADKKIQRRNQMNVKPGERRKRNSREYEKIYIITNRRGEYLIIITTPKHSMHIPSFFVANIFLFAGLHDLVTAVNLRTVARKWKIKILKIQVELFATKVGRRRTEKSWFSQRKLN